MDCTTSNARRRAIEATALSRPDSSLSLTKAERVYLKGALEDRRHFLALSIVAKLGA